MVDKFVNARDLVQKAMARLWKYAGEGWGRVALLSCRSHLPSLIRRLCKYIRVGCIVYVLFVGGLFFSSTTTELLQGHLVPGCSGQH